MTDIQVEKIKLTDLIPDDQNLNKGTERGNYALEESLRRYGFGRPFFVDKNRRIIGGNKTFDKIGEIDLAEEVILVKGNGKTVVVFQREDVDLDTPEGRALARADNRVGELNLEWDMKLMAHLMESGEIQDTEVLWTEEEIASHIYEELNQEPVEPPPKQNKEINCTCPECGHQFVRMA